MVPFKVPFTNIFFLLSIVEIIIDLFLPFDGFLRSQKTRIYYSLFATGGSGWVNSVEVAP